MLAEEGFGEAAGLAAEDEEVAGLEAGFPGAGRALGAEEPERGVRVGLAELLEAVPDVDLDVLPVVEAGTADVLVVEREAEGPDEMEDGTGGEAKPAGAN